MTENKDASLRVSVVAPVRGRPEQLAELLAKLRQQTLAPEAYEILICDDGSTPEDADRLVTATATDFRTRLLRQPARGPAAARNLGVANARAPIVAFVDSDTLPEPTWLESLLQPFADPDVVAVEGVVRPPAPAQSPLEEAPINQGGAHLTANMAYRRDVLVAVGGLDESFPLPAFEDVDLALCARKLGRIAFAPDAVVIHPWRRVTLQSSLRRLRQFDWLLVTALRHGCLGWESRPTRRPRLRIAMAAVVTLPIGRAIKGLRYFRQSPADAVARVAWSFAEAFAALGHAPRWLTATYPVERGRYLHSEACA